MTSSCSENDTMHEVSIMAEAVRLATEAAQVAGVARIARLRLRVGKLSGAVPEAMRFAWDVVSQNTMAAGAWLEIESVAGAGWCAVCDAEFVCDDFLVVCPRCHAPACKIVRGRELEIVAVEAALESATSHSKQFI